RTPMHYRIQRCLPALLFCAVVSMFAQAPAGPANASHRTSAATSPERRAILAFNSAKQSPLRMAAFLDRMPKGADLHMHLTGAVYAETFLKDAAADGLCVNMATLSLFKPAATTRS